MSSDSKEMKEYRRELRHWYKELKKAKSCAMCGRHGKKSKLQYHHLSPETKIATVSRMVHDCYPKEDIQFEIKKCVLICSTCHMRIHKKVGKKKKR